MQWVAELLRELLSHRRTAGDALRSLVTHVLKQEMLSRSLFTFCNQRRNRIRCLFFDGSGFWLATKRLEGVTYQWPKDPAAVMRMILAQLRLLL